jgi:hypothetical protein
VWTVLQGVWRLQWKVVAAGYVGVDSSAGSPEAAGEGGSSWMCWCGQFCRESGGCSGR